MKEKRFLFSVLGFSKRVVFFSLLGFVFVLCRFFGAESVFWCNEELFLVFKG